MADWRKYPFLHGLKNDDAEYACDVVEGTLSEKEKEDLLDDILSHDEFQQYLRWRSERRDAPIPPVRRTSSRQTSIVSKDDFLGLVPPPVRNLAEQKLDAGEYDRVKTLLSASSHQAGELFQRWRDTMQGSSSLSQDSDSSITTVVSQVPSEVIRVEVPHNFVSSLNWRGQFDQLSRMNLNCFFDVSIENGIQKITVRGELKKTLAAVKEIWTFIATTMEDHEYLPQWHIEMITNKWDLQKRFSFMGKHQVNLWVGERYSFPFVQINSWSPKETKKAIRALDEEWERIIAPEIIPVHPQFDTSRFPPVLNILVLGQSGVGKSTFINGIANYLMYRSFDESVEGQLKILVEFYASMMDAKGEEHHVKMESTESDENDHNERLGQEFAGQSATQRPKSYVLKYGHGENKRIVRFIDTPGVLDTAGIERDKEIMNQNMAYLANFPELHAILILMNPGEARLTPGLKYCVKELLCRLHRNASRNILFCFPRTGGNFFKESEGRITLERLVREIQQENGVEIPVTRDNKFTYENNGFTIRCQVEKARQGGFVMPSLDLRENAQAAWVHSAQETIRLFQKILTLTPNQVADHLNINTIRETVAALARPMSEVTRNQLMNRNIINGKMREIELLRGRAEDLRGKLHYTHVAIKTVPLDKPQTVCTAPKCVEYKQIGGGQEQPIHKTICHKDCHLVGVQEQVVNNPNLRNCAAFTTPDGKCWNQACRCEWTMHQHVRWMIETYEETKKNEDVEHAMSNVEDSAKQAEIFLRTLEEQDRQHVESCHRLAEIGAIFAVFLKNNCIAGYNDAFKEYLDAQIQQEERSVMQNGAPSALLTELQKYNAQYTEQRLEVNSSRDQTNANEVYVDYSSPFIYML